MVDNAFKSRYFHGLVIVCHIRKFKMKATFYAVHNRNRHEMKFYLTSTVYIHCSSKDICENVLRRLDMREFEIINNKR